MPRIVLSYRRDDSPGMALAIFNRLEGRYGPNTIFMDIDIPYGTDFRDHIDEVLNDCDALIAIVGRKWLGAGEGGRLRIKDDDDWVRLEVETSLRRGIAVIPALVDGATMPSKDQLPDSLDSFRFRQAAAIDSGRNFFPQMDLLIRQLDYIVQRKRTITEKDLGDSPVPSAQDPLVPHARDVVSAPSTKSDVSPQPAGTPVAEALPANRPREASPPPDALSGPVRVIAALLIVQALVRFGFLANGLSNSTAVYLNNLLLYVTMPAIIACGSIVAGILVLRRFQSARGFGLTICALGLVYQLYGLGTVVYAMSTRPSFNVPLTFWILPPAYIVLYLAGLVVLGRRTPKKLAGRVA
jgi:hypothetical protein